MYAISNFPKSIECTAPRLNPNVNYGLGMIMISQCMFISINRCYSDGGYNGKSYSDIGTVSKWEICIPFQYCCVSKTALKNEVY